MTCFLPTDTVIHEINEIPPFSFLSMCQDGIAKGWCCVICVPKGTQKVCGLWVLWIPLGIVGIISVPFCKESYGDQSSCSVATMAV